MTGSDVRTHINFLASRAQALQGELSGLLGVSYAVDMPAILQGVNLAAKLAEHLKEIANRPMPVSEVKP